MTNITRILLGDKVLAELPAKKTAVILGKDRKFDDNIVIAFGAPGSIEYNNIITAIRQGQIATLECEGLIFRDNVIVKTFGENDPELTTLDTPIIVLVDEEIPVLLDTPAIVLVDEEAPVVLGTPVIVLADEGDTPLILNTPTIYLSEIQDLSAILGECILGLAVLGKDSE